jgi:hypothetical protein
MRCGCPAACVLLCRQAERAFEAALQQLVDQASPSIRAMGRRGPMGAVLSFHLFRSVTSSVACTVTGEALARTNKHGRFLKGHHQTLVRLCHTVALTNMPGLRSQCIIRMLLWPPRPERIVGRQRCDALRPLTDDRLEARAPDPRVGGGVLDGLSYGEPMGHDRCRTMGGMIRPPLRLMADVLPGRSGSTTQPVLCPHGGAVGA